MLRNLGIRVTRPAFFMDMKEEFCNENNHNFEKSLLIQPPFMKDDSNCSLPDSINYSMNDLGFNTQNDEISQRYDAIAKNSHLTIPISLAVDGFRPVNHNRNEITPIYVRLEGVGRKSKEKVDSVILAALITGPNSLNHTNCDIIMSRLINELDEIRFEPIRIDNNNEIYYIDFQPAKMYCDLKAARLMYTLPNWQKLEGCALCTITDIKDSLQYIVAVTRLHRRHPHFLFCIYQLRRTLFGCQNGD
ncbi:unnamed protein product [Caenorhabditis bovis]|uniref:Uncharacterized protein n=1 Tax=Caenorhabditis bovis TaxID=2654633 RepID=A0A8S1ERB8_9PELO|nr:unnamed protein product [Caenorhabditis bovis]